MLADHTGLHPLDQKLTYKKKERDSKAYLDVAKVKDGSKMVLVEDIASKERRCLEMLRNAKMEKSSKSLSQISLEVDKLVDKVKISINGFYFFYTSERIPRFESRPLNFSVMPLPFQPNAPWYHMAFIVLLGY